MKILSTPRAKNKNTGKLQFRQRGRIVDSKGYHKRTFTEERWQLEGAYIHNSKPVQSGRKAIVSLLYRDNGLEEE